MAPYIGLDAARGEFTYFTLAFYRPIADAIAAGVRRFYLGTLLYAMKVRRGCHVVPTRTILYRGRSRTAAFGARSLVQDACMVRPAAQVRGHPGIKTQGSGTCDGPG